MSSNGGVPMETNKSIQLNMGTFNIPTLVGIVGLAAMVYAAGGKQERTDSRLDAIEQQRAARSVEVNKVLEALTTRITPIDNITYRVTVNEQGVADVNRRIDRINDSFGTNFVQIRADISALSTKFEVIAAQIQSLQDKKKGLPDGG